ncbi:MAG: translational GTPase TypA [Acidobacteria bacterium]|nr:MAG: translational GTPase TypA [Acidobacteriota bacterium]
MHGHVRRADIRNIAIIAHVDHGKTTLVDRLLQQTGTFRANERVIERVMDSNDLERERGITILAKNTSIRYRDVKINIVDTPGHADFGGEVERILGMVDGVLLLVDAAEGPLPQTRFVLKKSLELALKPIVVINKIDRSDARPHQVLDEVFQLMLNLGAADEQLDFPHLYASAKLGYARREVEHADTDVRPLLDTILDKVPCPPGDIAAPLQLQVSNLDYNDYVGRMAIGRIFRGTIRIGAPIAILKLDGSVQTHKVTRLETFEGLKRIGAEEAAAGEIVALAGIPEIQIGETIADPDRLEALPPIRIDEPTLSMEFMVNDSPLAGQDGRFVTSRHLRERLLKEARANVALRVEETGSPDTLNVSGRGELHLAILAETMRREGFEFQLSRPQVILRRDGQGSVLEPIEYLVLDLEEAYRGRVMEMLGSRRAELADMTGAGTGRVRLEFTVPARGLLGFRREFLTETRGTGIMSHVFHEYGPWRGDIPERTRGALVVKEPGVTVTYALHNLEDRGTLFVGPGVPVYEGMVVGEHTRENDLVVNPCKKKHLTNMRAAGADESLRLTPPRLMSLEDCIEFIAIDELVEVTPKNIRVRKRQRSAQDRKRRDRSQAEVNVS